MSVHSSRKSKRRKASAARAKKPYQDFPLYAHPLGYWSKKIRGKIVNFGRWARIKDGELTPEPYEKSWQDALAVYKAQAEDLHAGRTPRVKSDALTVKQLAETFLQEKHRKLQAGELGSRMFLDYQETCQLVADTFGKTRIVEDLPASDFGDLRAKMAERWGPVRLGNAITRVKSLFKFGLDNDLLDKPVRYGSQFDKPGKAVLRKHRAANGAKMLEAADVRKLIDKADVQLKAMLLLGVNVGFGNADISTLPLSALDLEKGWVEYPRPKTGIARRAALWPETVEALKAAIAARPAVRQKEAETLVFVNSRGDAWVRITEKSRTDNISVCFGELLKAQGLHRPGLNFYGLRHVFRTVADAARDPVAVDLVMGHADHTMGGHYREKIDDARLAAVSEHVRRWLFADKDAKGTDAADLKLYAG